MWNFTRKRQTAGNICLVLFTAFLFTILVTPFTMVDSAYAASGQGITAVQKQSGTWNEFDSTTITANASGQFALLVGLAVDPLSPVNFNTLNIKFEGASGTLTVYANEVAADSVYFNATSKVYSAAYTVPSTFKFSTTDIVYGKVYDGTTYLFNVALTLFTPPPDTSGGDTTGGPTGGTTGGTTTDDTTTDDTIQETDTSTVTTETADDGQTVANVEVKEDAVIELMTTGSTTTPDAPKEVTIQATSTAGSDKTVVTMGASVLTTATNTNTTLTVKTDLTQVKIKPTSVDSKSAATAMAAATATTQQTVDAINQAKSGTAPATTQTAVQKAVTSVVGQLTAKVTATEAVASAAQVAEAVKEVADKVAAGDGKVEITTSTVTASQAQVAEALGNSDNANMQAIGVVLDLNLAVKVKLDNPVNGVDEVSMPITEFAEPIILSLDPPADLTPGKEVILVKVENGKVIKTITGTYNSATGKLDFTMTDWSYWTMAIKVWAFADIIGHWAVNDIGVMADAGIVKGIADNKFAPDANITRAEFATMLVNALGLFEVNPSVGTFKDVKSSDWYYSMVETAARNGLAAGAHGYFNPNAKITRQEMAAMIANAMKKQGTSTAISAADAANLLNKFTDSKQIASWAQNSVALNVQKGIIVGRTDKTFAPAANATRAEGTVMIKKLLGK